MQNQTQVKTTGQKLDDYEVISALKNNLINYRTDIAERNTYIDKRDRYLYGDGLFENIDIPDGFDKTMYNWLRRTVEINRDQVFGQNFGIYSHFRTDDVSIYGKDQKPELEAAELANKMRQTRAIGKQGAIRGMIRDNGGEAIFKQGKQVGGAYGSTLYQMWYDKDQKKIKIQLLESVQNWYPVWSDNNFRDRLGDSYVSQIALETANYKYIKFLPQGDQWPVSFAGDPLINIQGGTSTLTNQMGETVSSATTRRPMVTKMNYTGILPNIKYDKKGNFVYCDFGDETKVSFVSVGNSIVEKTTKEDYMPSLYYIPNHIVPRRPYGESDLVESALQINVTYVQRMCDLVTLANKITFPMIQAKGFELSGIPKRKQREMTVIPMSINQELKPVGMPEASGLEREVLNELKAQFMIVTGMPRLVFDEASVTTNSAAALNTTMSAMQGIVADCQANWEPVLIDMFEDALELAGRFDKKIKDLLDPEDDGYLYIRWPSSMHKDNPQHQSMLINDLRAGTLSLESYLEQRGTRNVDEEINRLRNDLKDPVKAAILGGKIGELAQFTIFESLGIPLWGFNTPKISLKGDLTPQQEGNMGSLYGWNDGPYGATIGPQGAEGRKENENVINQGFTQTPGADPYAKYGMPAGVTPGQPINPSNPQAQGPAGQNPGSAAPQPMLTPSQNQPATQPMSMPGSGAPAMSAQGAVAQQNQRRGK